MTVRDVDKGYNALVKRVFGLGRPTIDVGVLDADEPKEQDPALTVLEVATWMEFGTDKVPPRSFIRAWFDENEERARQAVAVMLTAVVMGKYTKTRALHLLGQKFVGEIQKRISAGIPPENADSTVRQKRSSTPLIDTGQLRSSITYKVNEGDSSGSNS